MMAGTVRHVVRTTAWVSSIAAIEIRDLSAVRQDVPDRRAVQAVQARRRHWTWSTTRREPAFPVAVASCMRKTESPSSLVSHSQYVASVAIEDSTPLHGPLAESRLSWGPFLHECGSAAVQAVNASRIGTFQPRGGDTTRSCEGGVSDRGYHAPRPRR